jgi:hypothetical protein
MSSILISMRFILTCPLFILIRIATVYITMSSIHIRIRSILIRIVFIPVKVILRLVTGRIINIYCKITVRFGMSRGLSFIIFAVNNFKKKICISLFTTIKLQ